MRANPNWTQSEVLAREGWTKAAIRKFLGEPDDFAANRNHPGGYDICLYRRTRVRGKERSKAFSAWKAKSLARSAKALEVAEAKREVLLEAVGDWTPEIKAMPLREAQTLAREHYDRRNRLKDSASGEPSEFLDRITVNYLRHQGTEYDQSLNDLYAQVGKDEAADLVRHIVYRAIGTAYPELKAECDRQRLKRRLMY